MAYPFIMPSDNQIVKFFKKWIYSSESPKNEIVVADHNSMQLEALKIYLGQLKDNLCQCKLSTTFNVEVATKEALHVYKALSQPLVLVHGYSKISTWPCKELFEVSLQ